MQDRAVCIVFSVRYCKVLQILLEVLFSEKSGEEGSTDPGTIKIEHFELPQKEFRVRLFEVENFKVILK